MMTWKGCGTTANFKALSWLWLFLVYLTTIYQLCRYTASSSKMTVNYELGRMEMEAVMAYFKVLLWHMP